MTAGKLIEQLQKLDPDTLMMLQNRADLNPSEKVSHFALDGITVQPDYLLQKVKAIWPYTEAAKTRPDPIYAVLHPVS